MNVEQIIEKINKMNGTELSEMTRGERETLENEIRDACKRVKFAPLHLGVPSGLTLNSANDIRKFLRNEMIEDAKHFGDSECGMYDPGASEYYKNLAQTVRVK